MQIGVISDTHGLVRGEAVAALHGSDLILHAGDVGTHRFQPFEHPATLEAGMAGQKNLATLPEARIGKAVGTAGSNRIASFHQHFQGAFPLSQRASSVFLSRSVSIGCQKPR